MTTSLPNVILIGAQKGGTTALFDWLSQHPDVFGEPAMKDFPFFCRDDYLDKGLGWFAKRFSGWRNEKVILHGYVHYLFFSEDTTKHFVNMIPDVKLIAVLRNPVDRAFSAYLQAKKTGRENLPTFEQAIDYELTGCLEGFDDFSNRGYISHGMYFHQLQYLLKYFPAEKLKILLFDDLNNDPQGVYRELFEFMEVDSKFNPELVRRNDFGVPRTQIIKWLNASKVFGAVVRALVPLNMRIRFRHRLIQLNTRKQTKPELSGELRCRLQEIFEGDLKQLEELLGRSLDIWRQ